MGADCHHCHCQAFICRAVHIHTLPSLQVLGVIEEVFSKEATEQLAALEARAAEEAAAAAAASQRKAAEAGQEAAAAEGKPAAGKATQSGAAQEKKKAAAAAAAEEEVAAIQAAIADQAGEAVASDFVQVGAAAPAAV